MTTAISGKSREYREVLLTGATGFLGQAVLQAFLEHFPDVRVTSVVRAKGTQSGKDRLAGLLDKPVFTSWAECSSSATVRAAFDDRCDVLEGDLTAMPELDRSFDVVVHSASSVSFDPPINEAFATNVGGAKNLYEALLNSANALPDGQNPHVIHVSTSYVHGIAKGLRQEGVLDHSAQWRDEYAAALAAAERVDAQSRTPEVLKKLIRSAEIASGKMGPKEIAKVAEANRRDWVRSRLQEYGLQRANSLGWTDIYTFTKAMAERVGEELWAGDARRLSFVRPAIIESAVRHPYPGWIDGFKVADPLIMAYAKGRLPEFPGLADSILDIIPVDHIVGVILALATQNVDRRGNDAYYQVASGNSNPLPLHEMADIVSDYYRENPLEGDDGKAVTVPEWTFPSIELIEARFWATEKAAKAAQVAVGWLPGTLTTRTLAGKLHKNVAGLNTLRKFMDLYRSYTKTEMIFDDSNTRALRDELSDDFLRVYDFDITAVDWREYFRRDHLPAVTELTLEYSRKRAAKRAALETQDAGLEPGTDVVAVFDLDGTVIAQNIVQQYLAVVKATRPRSQWLREFAKLAGALPQFLRAESRDRSEFIRLVNRRYKGFTSTELHSAVTNESGTRIREQLKKEALERIEAHRAAGHRTVLVTGALGTLVEPIADLFDDVIATRMHEVDGVLTGYLDTPPVVAEARASWLRTYAATHNIDLAKSYGYGDSHADAPWLALLGHPTAVSPDLGLFAEAKKNRWPMLEWK